MNISLLLPTRRRPKQLKRLCKSILNTAKEPDKIEICLYIDSDDGETMEIMNKLGVRTKTTIGSRILLSNMWNEAYKTASADVFMHCGDDIIFRSKHWDKYVLDVFDRFEDKIVFVHGNDLGYGKEKFGTHGFLHRRWVEALGYFCPPYFSSDYNDTWLNDVANAIGRRVFVADVITEHMHYTFGKGELDQTHQERIERHRRDNVEQLYKSLQHKRDEDVEKLKAVMLKREEVIT